MEDKEIIELFFQRDEKAIELFDQQYRDYCYFIAHRILNSDSDARECLNDTYRKLWESIPPAKPESLKSYGARIIRNLAINRYNHDNAQKRSAVEVSISELENVLSAGNSVKKAVDYDLLVSQINDFLAHSSRKERALFVKRYFFFRTVSEIADETGLSETNVTTILSRTRARLKEYLIREGYEL